jgi:sugar/nucleoside kinase (ribokinase family)
MVQWMINRVPRLHASAVTCDNRSGAEQLAALLLAAGHVKFAIVKGGDESSNSVERERAFTEYVSANGGEVVLRVGGGSSYDCGFAAGRMFAEMPAASGCHLRRCRRCAAHRGGRRAARHLRRRLRRHRPCGPADLWHHHRGATAAGWLGGGSIC